MYHHGVVTGLRRQDQEVDAVVMGTKLSAEMMGGKRTPWPFAEALFWQRPDQAWVCLGPTGHRELLFHDDFLQVTSPNGDTPWTLRTSGAGGSLAAETAMGVGAARVRKTVGAGVAFIHKTIDAVVVPTPPFALWASAKFRFATAAATWFTGLSANDVPALYAVAATSDVTKTSPAASTHFGLRLDPLVSATQFLNDTAVEGTTATVNTWYTGDLLIWVDTETPTTVNAHVGWIDGNGPAAGVGGTSGAITPMFGIYNDVDTDVGIDCYADWIHWERVTLAPTVRYEVGAVTF